MLITILIFKFLMCKSILHLKEHLLQLHQEQLEIMLQFMAFVR